MSQGESQLTQLKPECWRELQSKFKVDWPEHILAYDTIGNAIRRFEKFPQENGSTKIYTLDNSWRENGTFIARLVSIL